jgi:hypothetical protein
MALESPKMMRMRYIKPQVLSHLELHELETKTGLPARIAWVGLICFADKRGRFVWQPKLLRVHVLPYDVNADFSIILKGLEDLDMVHKYTLEGKSYGHIPSWAKHQGVNNKEPESTLPDPEHFCTKCAREPRVLDASATGEAREVESVKCEVSSGRDFEDHSNNETTTPLAAVSGIED